MVLKYVVLDNKYKNINQILNNEFSISSRLLHKLILNKHVLLNGKTIDTRNEINLNDIVEVNLDFDEESENIIAKNIPISILYEDDALLILNKQPNIAVHPSILHYDDSLSNGVKFYFESIGLERKIRPVNRLDFATSGIVIFAKNEYIQECLIKQMIDGTFKKEYIAIVDGIFYKKSGIINLPISRKDDSIIERCVSNNGKSAITEYEVLNEISSKFSIVKCILKTGRTHQIRVHLSYIGHPILGDTLYGTSSDLIDRQALHSYKVSFIHPITHKKLDIICDLPNDMRNKNTPLKQ